jgi:hypothetical protein
MLRKFRDALKESPRAMALFMKDVAELYAIERQARDEGMDADARRALRQRESLPIAMRLMQLTSGWQAHYSLKGKVADAMKYARGQRRALLAFLRDGRIPIDNNACERSIRPVAIGRGNWMVTVAASPPGFASSVGRSSEPSRRYEPWGRCGRRPRSGRRWFRD